MNTNEQNIANVKEFRERFNLSQSEMGELCGVSTRAVQYWEQGKVPVPKRTIKLMETIIENNEIISPDKGSENAPKTSNPDDKFYETLARQQEIMSKQLEELIELRKLAAQKDEQIDRLLKMLDGKQ